MFKTKNPARSIYGLQKGDGTPDVAFEEQIEMTVDFITYNSK